MAAWLLREDRQIVEMRQRGMPAKVIARHIGRSAHSVAGRLWILGAKVTEPWTPAEDSVVLEHYRKAPVAAWLHLLPGRGEAATHTRAWRLGLARKRRVWAD